MSAEKSPLAALQLALLKYAENKPDSVIELVLGQRLINQGDISDSSLYLIKDGAAGITVRQPGSKHEETVALRIAGDLVGEMTFLERSAPRTASVQVASPIATFVRISKLAVFELIRVDPSLREGLNFLWELAASRRKETYEVLDGRISVENRVMSVLLTDIHNFTSLGEATWEEQSNTFLFEFMEASEEIAVKFNGSFEDQGDGHKVVVRNLDYIERAIKCAIAISDMFVKLRDQWIKYNDAFSNIGLGIGICTDLMSIRRSTKSSSGKGRVLSHAINIAAAMSKFRAAADEVEIYADENTASMASRDSYGVEGPQQKYLERLGRFHAMYRIARTPSQTVKNTIADQIIVTPKLPSQRERIKVLFLSSEPPSDEDNLRLQKEAREIEQNLRAARFRNRFSFKQVGAARVNDLSRAMLDFEPQIVHFSGHGASTGELCFESEDGQSHPVAPQALAALFKEFQKIKCVILNACYSSVQATAISNHVPYVIGMNSDIADKAAIAFSIGLYQALGAGKTIDEAYRFGCAEIHLHTDGHQASIPTMLKKESSTQVP